MVEDSIAAFLHKPFRRTGSPTDTYGSGTLKPMIVNLVLALDLVAVGIDGEAAGEQRMPVAALAPADEDDDIMMGGKR